MLLAKDVTGSTPAQLASNKHHRYLARYLEDAERKEKQHHSLFGRAGALWFMTSTQLCPFIWFIIIGLVSLFVYKASSLCDLPRPHYAVMDLQCHWKASLQIMLYFTYIHTVSRNILRHIRSQHIEAYTEYSYLGTLALSSNAIHTSMRLK